MPQQTLHPHPSPVYEKGSLFDFNTVQGTGIESVGEPHIQLLLLSFVSEIIACSLLVI